jgi:predicted flap endonuclease-1-like 5' DNA nuclease
MPTIELTEEQLDRLEAVRDDVAETLGGPYGHTRVQDAVEYLLDTYTPPEEGATPDTDDDAESTADDATAESADSTDGGLASLEPVGSAKAAALERAGYETPDDLREASVDELTEISGVGETLAERILDAVSGETDEANADAPESASDQGEDDGTNRLDAMMNLLDEHDDKWHESDGDEPYEVELPDGSVETARTKDDIRGILFRHY